MLRARNGKISAWLTVLPLTRSQFDLSAQEFWDALVIRYKKPFRNVQDLCDGCSSQFSLSHALSCREGGLVIQTYNEIQDAIEDLASLVWSHVMREPVVREANTKNSTSTLIANLAIRSVWLPQTEVLFHIRVIDTDTQSYSDHSPKEVLRAAEGEKKKKIYGCV